MYTRRTKKYPSTLWEKLYGPVLLLAIAFLSLVISTLNIEPIDYSYPVTIVPSKDSIITTAEHYKVIQGYNLVFKNISFVKSFLYPNNFVEDTFYQLSAVIICSLVIVVIYKEHKKGIFMANLSKHTKALATVFLLMYLLNTLRWIYLKNLVSTLTKNNFHLDFLTDQFYRPEFWLMIVLGIITVILKKGEALQDEQNLTV